ncbi:MAG TPA: PilZ domain-containing protein [Bryobacteraceae bacterium]|nr:PilZ domain-containing protein [Bryobacteraceae bacterium]
MDRRYSQRISAQLPVRLMMLEGRQETSGRLLDVSESGVSALLPAAAEPGALVKLEILGLFFFGHVAYCNPDGGEFRIGIFVEPAVLDSSNLTELVDSFLIDRVG